MSSSRTKSINLDQKLKKLALWFAMALAFITALMAMDTSVYGKKKKAGACKASKYFMVARDATGKSHNIRNYKESVVMAVYAGKNTADVNDKVYEAMKNDPELGKGGSLNKEFIAFGIANYQETWVPNAIIAWLIKRKIEKYGVTIWDDRDNCFSGSGESDDCVGDKRRRIFVDEKHNATIFYKGTRLRNFVGYVNQARFIKYIKALAKAGKKNVSVCEVKESIKY